MYESNHLGCIFLGDMAGTWGHGGDLETSQKRGSYLKEHKQAFRVYLLKGHGGTWGHGGGLEASQKGGS